IEATNTITSVSIIDSDTGKEKTKSPNATATVTFEKKTPAPGFAKLAAASFPGQVYDEKLLQPVNEGFITAGDTLIWHAVVYNGKGEADADLATLKNYTITDTLPNNYQYDRSTTGFTVKAFKYTYDTNTQTGYSVDSTTGLLPETGGTKVTLPEGIYDATTNTITWELNGEDFALETNELLVIEFSTVVKENMEKEGTITNTGYATFDQAFSVQDVVAGEANGKEIHNYANYNIVGLTTESWKTITYTSQNHTVDKNGHDDPITDTGYSRQPTHNYVQGMQTEDVQYQLIVQNTSVQDLENFVIIDRLPFVGDKGLVSDYERNSAFEVSLNTGVPIKAYIVDKSILENLNADGSINLDGQTPVGATITYSKDKDSPLNEYSGDWRGQNDVMNWSNSSEGAYNFRVEIDSSEIVAKDQCVIVTFTGTVPAYVKNTGEENIAWNSFAYGYQNQMILGDTYMVAEPAKVGVWVETPEAENTITINKELTGATGGTFYFALFEVLGGGNYNRLSDVMPMTLGDSQSTGSITMQDLDYALLETKKTNQANAIAIFETDFNGNVLLDGSSAYKVTYKADGAETEADAATGAVIDTDKTTNVVTVGNEKQVGTITVNKTLKGGTKADTVYFALFTKNGNTYERYMDADVKALSIGGSTTTGYVTFTDVPVGKEFYVLETNANGVLTDSDITKYTSVNGISYTVAYEDNGVTLAAKDDKKVSVTNTQKQTYSIHVTKAIVSEDIQTSPAFYVGLYDSTGKLIEVKPVNAGGSVTFSDLEADTYSVYECDKDGKKVGDTITKDVYLTEAAQKAGTATQREFTVSYEDNEVTFPVPNPDYISDEETPDEKKTLDTEEVNATVTNKDTTAKMNYISVTKYAAKENTEGTEKTYEPIEKHTITVGLFTLKDGEDSSLATSYELIDGKTAEIETEEDGYGTATFTGLDTGEAYYVFELDSDGKTPLLSGGITTVDQDKFEVSYSGNLVILTENVSGEADISDIQKDKVELSFTKTDVNGDLFARATMSISNADGEVALSWETTDNNPYTTSALTVGTYTLTETAMPGFVPVSVEFTVGDDGYIIVPETGAKTDSYSITSTGITVVNRSVVNVSKQDFGKFSDEDSTNDVELPGAFITITNNNGKSIGSVTLTRGSDTLTNEKAELTENGINVNGTAVADTTNCNNYAISGSVLGFYSGSAQTVITGLPDGDYTMKEVAAPNGYVTLETTLTFKIKNGVVSSENKDKHYTVTSATGNLIVMADDAQSKLTIGKYDITGQTEVAGATLKLTATDVDWSDVKLGTESGSEEVTFTSVMDETDITKQIGIQWTSGKDAVVIQGLPDGTYTLEETAAEGKTTFEGTTVEDGKEVTKTYKIVEGSMTFTLDGGVITESTNTENTTEDQTDSFYYYNADAGQNTIKVCDAVFLADITISKKDVTREKELAGAELTLTNAAVDWTAVLDADENLEAVYADDQTTVIGVKWTSGESEKTIAGLPMVDGYVLKEETAPAGYGKLETSFAFSLETGAVAGTDTDGYTVEGNKIVVGNTLNTVSISKKDANGTGELAGATLQVISADLNWSEITTVAGFTEVMDETDETKQIGIQWTSGTEAVVIQGLPKGDYTLKEISAPAGYTIAEEISFSIAADGTVTSGALTDGVIVMTDK
ncbi:MAG: prealbumin-like fold domain-containing protein, partial [Ruminococcus sp.]